MKALYKELSARATTVLVGGYIVGLITVVFVYILPAYQVISANYIHTPLA